MFWCWLFGGCTKNPSITCHCWGCGMVLKDDNISTWCCSIPPLCICRKRCIHSQESHSGDRKGKGLPQKEKTTTDIKTACCLNTVITRTQHYKQTSIKCGDCYEKISYKEYNTGSNKDEYTILNIDHN